MNDEIERLKGIIEQKDKEIEADNRNAQDFLNTIHKLEEDTNSWRRVCERLEGEKTELKARNEKLERANAELVKALKSASKYIEFNRAKLFDHKEWSDKYRAIADKYEVK